MKQFMKTLAAVVFNCLFGIAIASAAGISPVIGMIAMNGVGLVMSLAPQELGRLCAGVYTEVWTGELIKPLRAGLEGTWLDGIPDYSQLVNNDVIHMVDVGADPDVLLNNTTYPIDIQELTDEDKVFSLNKFQTKATPVTDDELYAISYDKMARVIESHANAINDTKFKMAAHALCPESNTDTTPVLTATGDVDEATGRIRICVADIAAMKRALDKLKVPATNRRLVLSTDHVNDLLLTDQAFREQYNIDRNNGTVGKLYGFDIYEFANNPYYTADGTKKAWDAEADDGEYQASFAIYTPRVFKATGSTKFYYSASSTDPQYQRNLVNYRHYFIVLPKKADAAVALISGYNA